MAACIMSVSIIGTSVSAEGMNEDVTLTEEQKEEMEFLQKNALDQHIGIISKYVEYGVFTKEKGDKIISHFQKHYEELEKNGFIPKWDKHKHKKGEHQDNE